MSAPPNKHIRLPIVLFIAVMVAAFVVGFASAALADIRFFNPHPPPTVVRVIATPIPPAPTPVATPIPVARRSVPAVPSSGRCGGSLPTCSVMRCESGGDIRVRNRSGSSASGKWQITRGTWNGYGGYAEARDAPEHVQDAKARELWAGGAGSGHWRSCL